MPAMIREARGQKPQTDPIAHVDRSAEVIERAAAPARKRVGYAQEHRMQSEGR